MKKQCITAANAPAAVGPYSHAVRAGQFLFVSGQVPIYPDGSGPLRGSVADQARLALSNLKAILDEAGAQLDDVVKTTVFITDMSQFSVVNEVYKEFFKRECPARSCVQVAALPLNVDVEVEAIVLVSA